MHNKFFYVWDCLSLSIFFFPHVLLPFENKEVFKSLYDKTVDCVQGMNLFVYL